MQFLKALFLGSVAILSSGAGFAAEAVKLKPNDVVSLKVYEEPDLDTQVRISKGGEASFHLIGPVKIAGLDLRQATQLIQDRYSADYLVDPKITLTVVQEAAEYVTVIGAVNTPGQVTLPSSGRLDLASAIAVTGGLSEKADANRITVHRADGSSSTYSEASLKSNNQIPLRPGDRVIVGESRFLKKQVMIYGPVGRQGPVQFPLDGNLDLLNAISMAGGFTNLANQRRVTLLRNGVTRVINVRELIERGAARIPLQPDDVITVAERRF